MCLPFLAPIGAALGASAGTAAAVGTVATAATVGSIGASLYGSSQAKAAAKGMQPPTAAALPTPAPLPTVSSSQSSIQDNQAAARNRLRYGLASTIKTNQGSLLNTTNQGKTTLG